VISETTRQPRLVTGFGEELEALLSEALEGVGRSARLERAAAERHGTLALDPLRGGHELFAGLDGAGSGHDLEGAAGADVHRPHADARPVGMVLAAGELVGLRDTDDLLDSGQGNDVLDAFDVGPDHADHSALLSNAHERLEADSPRWSA